MCERIDSAFPTNLPANYSFSRRRERRLFADSPECTAIIRPRHKLTVEAFERVQSRIQSLANSDLLLCYSEWLLLALQHGDGLRCGRAAVAERCASCLNCEQQASGEMFDLFFPLPVVPSTTLSPKEPPSTA